MTGNSGSRALEGHVLEAWFGPDPASGPLAAAVDSLCRAQAASIARAAGPCGLQVRQVTLTALDAGGRPIGPPAVIRPLPAAGLAGGPVRSAPVPGQAGPDLTGREAGHGG